LFRGCDETCNIHRGKNNEEAIMPPTFPYFLAIIVWIPATVLLWMVAGILALFKKTRLFAKSITLSMAGTFPGVFVFQLLVLPIVAIFLFAAIGIEKTYRVGFNSDPSNNIKAAIGVPLFLIIFFLMLGASVIGFYDGWRIGWRMGQGKRFREAMIGGPFYCFWKQGLRLKVALHVAKL
jgi:hypothetical protein